MSCFKGVTFIRCSKVKTRNAQFSSKKAIKNLVIFTESG